MRFPWTATPQEKVLQKEILSENEIKDRFESISKFMLEYQKQYFDGLKFSLNMWMLINSGAAIALLNSGNKQLINIAIFLMIGVLLTGAASILLNNAVHRMMIKLFDYALTKNISLHEFYANMKLSFSILQKNILFALCIPYAFFALSILMLGINIEI